MLKLGSVVVDTLCQKLPLKSPWNLLRTLVKVLATLPFPPHPSKIRAQIIERGINSNYSSS